jgi:hypothetical protein
MQRRSAVTRLAASVAGLSLGQVPDLGATVPRRTRTFSVTRANLAESSGTVTCPVCQEMWDSLELTPAGLCLRCSDESPTVRSEPHSEPFWTLSHTEIRRVELEIDRLAAELDRINRRLAELKDGQTSAADVYDRRVEAERDRWHALQRELHLLQLLRAASRQFGR